MTVAATSLPDATMGTVMTDLAPAGPANIASGNLAQYLSIIDAALLRFSGAELASASEVCDVLLDLRLLAAAN